MQLKRKLIITAISCNMLLCFTPSLKIKATSLNESENTFITVGKDGVFKVVDMKELETETMMESVKKFIGGPIEAIADNNDIEKQTLINPDYGVVNFKTKWSSTQNTSYKIVSSNTNGYTNGYYAADGAFLGYSEDGEYVKFMQAGATGLVKKSEVEVLDYDSDDVKSVNFYRVENGRIYHYGTNNIKKEIYWLVNDVGPKQSYMQNYVPYYSYDGHYFYKDYKTMIKDYKADTRKNSINPNNPYYNYYQYLSHRSKTNFTAEQLDGYLNSLSFTQDSKMKDTGKYFIEHQNTYGINALLMYGVAINESAYGLSTISADKNNLFGHGAIDSNPYYGANGYETVSDSIKYHSQVFLSQGYSDPCDGSWIGDAGYMSSVCLRGRYYGMHLGDKESGINVKYASDPFWGEKAARVAWEIEDYYGNKGIDTDTIQIGIKKDTSMLNVRTAPNTISSKILYQTPANQHFAFIILGEYAGEKINGSTKWYRVQADTALNSKKDKIIQGDGTYDMKKDIGYVHSSYVVKINTIKKTNSQSTVDKNNSNKEEEKKPEATQKPSNETTTKPSNNNSNNNTTKPNNTTTKPNNTTTEVKIKKGDVNGDNKISAVDYLMIKDYIMGKKKLDNKQKKGADTNGDNKVTSADYLMIKDSIMGKIKL